jgi:probable HAF family extracellular repeat protein
MGFVRAYTINLLAVLSIALTAEAAPPQYTITDLGTFGGRSAEAMSINDFGQIVGWSSYANEVDVHAFRIGSSPITPAADLGIPSSMAATGANTLGAVINNAGQIAMEAIPHGASGPLVPWQTWLIPSGGNISNAVHIGTLGGNFAVANGMNSSGHIVGRSSIFGDRTTFAYRWTPESGMVNLGTLGGEFSEAWDINDLGQVVGVAENSVRMNRAFRTSPGATIKPGDDLGTLAGSDTGAYVINNLGQVAGISYVPAEHMSHIFRTAPNAPINLLTDDFGPCCGGSFPGPFDMNDQGDVVGSGYLIKGDTRYELNSLIPPGSGWDLIYGSSINEAGQIVGGGLYNGSNYYHAFLLTPVPEPGMVGLVLILPLMFSRRRPARS